MIASLHQTLGWVFVYVAGATGLVGIVLTIAKREPNRLYWGAAIGSLVLGVAQVSLGLVMLGQGQDPGGFHTFYGAVLLFTAAFAYVYKSQLSKRPALYWALLLLFAMGIGLRGIANFGRDIGA